MKKEFIRLSAILCTITLVAGLLLAGVNKITAPAIEKSEKRATEEAMKKILPQADNFAEISDEVTLAKKGDDKIGFCTKVVTSGYGGDIVMMVGMDLDENIQGIEILSHAETAGLGAKIADDDFKEQFKGKSASAKVVKMPTDSPDEFTAVTGATISSRGVEEGLKQAASLVKKALKEDNK